MKINIYSFLYLFVSITLFSCATDKKHDTGTTFISGMIVNPKLDYVIISQGNQLLDTLPLDSSNFFAYKTDKITEEGLYILRHYETQMFFVEPGDSLVLHLNTMDFDESLNYSGRGAAKNNLLMTLFLMNENENKKITEWYTLPPEEYISKIDSLRKIKEKEYNNFLSQHQVSKKFKEIALTSINYDYYSKRELYGLANKNRLNELPDNFYSYRQNIDFGNDYLQFYYPYYRFLNRLFDNLIVEQHPFGTDRNSFKFCRDKLRSIDSLSTTDSIRNNFSRATTLRFLIYAKKEDEKNAFLEEFLKVNNNPKHIKEIRDLHATAVEMSQGKIVPDISLFSMDNTITNLHDVINGPTVLYFWSYKSTEQAKAIHNRAAELRSKYPEYRFIGINRDNHFRRWRSKVNQEKYNVETEFQMENPAHAEDVLILTNLNKSIIIDKDKTILDGSTNMFHQEFEKSLLGYLNR